MSQAKLATPEVTKWVSQHVVSSTRRQGSVLGFSGLSELAVPGDIIAAAAATGQEGQHPFEPGPFNEGEGTLGGGDRPYPCRQSR